MRAICANPASPLGENDFFRNQTGKLGTKSAAKATKNLLPPKPSSLLPSVKSSPKTPKVSKSFIPSDIVKTDETVQALADSANSLALTPQVANFAPEKSYQPLRLPIAAVRMIAKAIHIESQSSFLQRSEILNLLATTISFSGVLDIFAFQFHSSFQDGFLLAEYSIIPNRRTFLL